MAHTELVSREGRKIDDFLNVKMSVNKFAAEIGSHRSPVFRKINRNWFVEDELPRLNAQRSVLACTASQTDAVCGLAKVHVTAAVGRISTNETHARSAFLGSNLTAAPQSFRSLS